MTSTHAQLNGQCADAEFQSEEAWAGSPLWSVLLGNTTDSLEGHLDGLERLLADLYQTHVHYPTIEHMMTTISHYPANTKGLVCRRAILLLALNREHEIASYFIDKERQLGPGVGPTRVALLLLEALVPMYLRDFCQDPDALVRRCTIALDMGWGRELWERERRLCNPSAQPNRLNQPESPVNHDPRSGETHRNATVQITTQ